MRKGAGDRARLQRSGCPTSRSGSGPPCQQPLSVVGVVLLLLAVAGIICLCSIRKKLVPGNELGIGSSSGAVRERRRSYQARKEIGVMAYISKVMRVLFMVFGFLTILLSVILDYLYNHKPLRFIPFGILAPLTIFIGFLASGWYH